MILFNISDSKLSLTTVGLPPHHNPLTKNDGLLLLTGTSHVKPVGANFCIPGFYLKFRITVVGFLGGFTYSLQV